MELTESLDTINKRLIEYFGTTIIKQPIYRVVWSEDQYEKRLVEVTAEGLQLLYPEMREMPKYRHYIRERYILEKLSVVPSSQAGEISEVISYEPLWCFEDRHGNALPPKWEAAKLVIDSVLAARGDSSLYPKYVDPEKNSTPEQVEEKLKKIEESLFGNETNTSDALAHKQAIIVPRNYSKEIH